MSFIEYFKNTMYQRHWWFSLDYHSLICFCEYSKPFDKFARISTGFSFHCRNNKSNNSFFSPCNLCTFFMRTASNVLFWLMISQSRSITTWFYQRMWSKYPSNLCNKKNVGLGICLIAASACNLNSWLPKSASRHAFADP
jgi:hypothetical protein